MLLLLDLKFMTCGQVPSGEISSFRNEVASILEVCSLIP